MSSTFLILHVAVPLRHWRCLIELNAHNSSVFSPVAVIGGLESTDPQTLAEPTSCRVGGSVLLFLKFTFSLSLLQSVLSSRFHHRSC